MLQNCILIYFRNSLLLCLLALPTQVPWGQYSTPNGHTLHGLSQWGGLAGHHPVGTVRSLQGEAGSQYDPTQPLWVGPMLSVQIEIIINFFPSVVFCKPQVII